MKRPIKSKATTKPAVVKPVTENDDDGDAFFLKKPIVASPFTQQLPAERVWLTAPVTETAVQLLAWLVDCQTLVDQHFGANVFTLHCKAITNYFWITLQSQTELRSFAFVGKSTGDIHCPAVFDEPFTSAHGNISDVVTRLSIMSPWGVTTPWSWLPTFADSSRFSRKR